MTFVKRCCIIKMYTEMLFLKSIEIVPIFWSCVNGCERRILKVVKKMNIAIAGTGDGDIIGTTKKKRVKSRLLAA